ncbi:MAG: SH3 domain-containing protein [Nitrospira sp.]|nr:SH3 domain-containing protein [Nitrospira sp.]
MFAIAGGPSLAGSPLTWNLFFARQPEPDLEFTEEELEQTATVRSPSPQKPPKKSSGRPLLWVLLLIILIGGGAYVAMEPEMIMDYVGPLLGESPAPQPQPPVARRPAPLKPAPPVPAATQPQAAVSAPPSAAPVEVPQAAAPATAPVPAPPAPLPMPMAATPIPAPSSPEPAPVAPITATPTPLFGEGQRVSVLADPTNPGAKVLLALDAEGTKPGPAIPPGTALTILDGDLQTGGWIYFVRSDFGTKGWLAEKQLKLKP